MDGVAHCSHQDPDYYQGDNGDEGDEGDDGDNRSADCVAQMIPLIRIPAAISKSGST